MRYAQGGGFDTAGRARREQVRLRAADLLDAGHGNVEIAKMLRVTPKSVSPWKAQYRQVGHDGLASKGHGGRQQYLTDEQTRELAADLDEGPAVHGYQDDQHWTLARIRDLIHEMLRVRYKDVSTVSRLLDRAGYSRQAPARRAAERDEQPIAAWREESWPENRAQPEKPRIPLPGLNRPGEPAVAQLVAVVQGELQFIPIGIGQQYRRLIRQ